MSPRKFWISGLVKSFLMQFWAKIAILGGLQNLAIVLVSYNIIPRSQCLRRRGSASYRIRMHEHQARPLGARIASFPGFRKAYRRKWSGGKWTNRTGTGGYGPETTPRCGRTYRPLLLHLLSGSSRAGIGLRFSLVLKLSTACPQLLQRKFSRGRPRISYATV